MKQNSLKIQDIKTKLSKDQLLDTLLAKNIQGGAAAGDPPPFGVPCR